MKNKNHVMKKITLIILTIMSSYLQAQSIFNKTYIKPDWDFSTAIIETDNNSYLIASSSRSESSSSYDILLMNIDTLGTIIWEKYIGHSQNLEFASNISKTSDGGFIIGGSYSHNGNYDTYILKVDSEGNKIWAESVTPSAIYEHGYSAFENAQGEFMIIGSDNHTNIYNLNSSGSMNWVKNYQNFAGKLIFQTSDDGYALIGNTSFSTGQNNQIVLMKVDINGDSIWTKQFGGDGDDYAYSCTPASDNGFLIAGGYDTQVFDDDLSTYLIRTNSIGDIIWTKIYETGFPYAIQQTFDGGFVYSSVVYQYLPLNDLYTLNITKIDSMGTIEWSRSFENRNVYSAGNNLQQVGDGGYILTGHVTNNTNSHADVSLIKLDVNGNFVTSIRHCDQSISQVLKAFPNPVLSI